MPKRVASCELPVARKRAFSPRPRVPASPRRLLDPSPRPRVPASPRRLLDPSPRPRVPASPRRLSDASPRRAFTLIEMLVVMAVIVLAVTMAIPAIKFLTGSRSQESADNTLSSYISFTRNDAMGLQQIRGVMLFLDDDDHVKCAEVMQVPSSGIAGAVPGVVYLDTVPDRDTLSMPGGIRVWTLKDQPLQGSGLTDPYPRCTYLGFNNEYVGGSVANEKNGAARIGGVILFGPDGRLVTVRYGFSFTQLSGSGTVLSGLGTLVCQQGTTPPPWPTGSSTAALYSQIGLVMCDKEEMYTGLVQGAEGESDITTGTDTTINPYFATHTTPSFVNRYSGTLMQAE